MAEIRELVHAARWKQINPTDPAAGFRCVHEGAAGRCGEAVANLAYATDRHVRVVKAPEPALELAQIQARADAATQGPWEVAEEVDGWRSGRQTVVKAPREDGQLVRVVTVDQTRTHHDNGSRDAPGVAEANIRFIAHARQDIPQLLETIRQLRERVATAEALSFSHGFELARQAPTIARARGWQAQALKLEGELAVLRAHISGVDDWLEGAIDEADRDIAAAQRRGRVDGWDQGWSRAMKLARGRLRAGQAPVYEVDHGCECAGACPYCARYGCEACCDGEMPSNHGARDGNVQTPDYDDLRRHLASSHCDGGALGLSDYEALLEHAHEHEGPGTIRNHDVDSRDWSQEKIDDVIAGLKEMEGGNA